MNRRRFMKRSALVGSLSVLPSISAQKIETGLCELTTTEYEYIFRDFKERHPDHWVALRKASWMITDLLWASRDAQNGGHPCQRQLTLKEEDMFEEDHGFRPSYYWRYFAELARQLLAGKASTELYRPIFNDGKVTIYRTADFSSTSIGLMYVFHGKKSVGRVLLSTGGPER